MKTAMSPIPKDSPLMKAWEAYKATPEYANTLKWSADEEHREGALWAAFAQAWEESQPRTAQAGMAWRDIAASAYRAYAASTGNKNFRGEPMPEFGDLPQPIRTAWEAAVRQVGHCIDNGSAPDESHWKGWTAP